MIEILESYKVILKEALIIEVEKEKKCLIETAFKEGFTSNNTVVLKQKNKLLRNINSWLI
ncbi:Spo0E family sporulation regulatory protein-aspartic acid phosphatase [Priestia megaterium]|nr:Spo0E family sporulation regulatory protein-aspartic acid phosphatase [Priestia megaterium]